MVCCLAHWRLSSHHALPWQCHRKAWGPTACSPKANKQTRSVEREVGFISDAGNWEGEGRHLSKVDSSANRQGRRASQVEEGATWRNSILGSDSHLHTGRQRSDLRHLDCFRQSSKFLFLGSICFHFFEDSSRNCDGYIMVIVWWSRSYLLHLVWLLGFIRQFTGYDSSVGKESARKARDPGSIPGLGRSTGGRIGCPLQYSWVSLVAQLVKNLPAKQETWVWSLGWEDPLEKGRAAHTSILAWRIPWTV